MRVEVVDGDRLAARAAELVGDALVAAVATRGSASVALSGGATPVPMFAALAAREDLAWDRVHVWQVDERVAPDGHDDRNLNAIVEHLGPVVPAENLHAMPVGTVSGQQDLSAAADAYEVELRQVLGDEPVLDVVQLGIGADGHTASLFPGRPVAAGSGSAVAVAGPHEGRYRLTLTMDVLDRSGVIVWMVAGSGKAAVAQRLRDADHTIPAGRVRRDRAVLLLDTDAAGAAGR